MFFIAIVLIIGSIGGLAMLGTMTTNDPSTSTDTWGNSPSPQTVKSAELVTNVARTEGEMTSVFVVFVAAATVLIIALGAFSIMRKKGYGSRKYRTG